MLFSQEIFLIVFLPCVLLLYFYAGRFGKSIPTAVLLISSIFFYGYYKPEYVFLILGSIVLNYIFGLMLLSYKRREILIISVLLNLFSIGYFKYAGFIMENTNILFKQTVMVPEILLPLGISFYTFQQIAWLVDCYKAKTIEDHSFISYGLFVSFFPQLVAGPIVHHSEVIPQFAKQENRHFNAHNFSIGITVFIVGLFKKIVIADSLAVYANAVFQSAHTGIPIDALTAWLGAISFSMQIYFDFSGYSDMAVGLGRMMNIILPINFYSPYQSLSIIEFWRKWHTTLSRFLRDYLYIPLGGNRRGFLGRYGNLMITMLIGGLWHGASWTFVFWGGLHGIYLIVNHVWAKIDYKLPPILAWLITNLSIVIAWVFFRADTFHDAGYILSRMFSFDMVAGEAVLDFLTTGAWCVSTMLIVTLLPNIYQIMRLENPAIYIYRYDGSRISDTIASWVLWQRNSAWLMGCMVLLLCSLYGMMDTTKIKEFIYFRF